ncbi:hypothetical protein L0P92_41440, partial [Streptomyces muensis]|nr:hypothetical protein [Streptomyces muensis]
VGWRGGPGADLIYHGSAVLSGDRVDVRFTPRRQGAGGVSDGTAMVRLREAVSEVMVEFDTVWSGGPVDGTRRSGGQRVLLLDTGDAYHF